MKSRAMSGNKGFTMIEIILVMGISAVIGAIGIGLGLGSAAKNICVAEFGFLNSVILRARNLAATLANTDEKITVAFEEDEIKILVDNDNGNGETLFESFLLSPGFVATSSSEFFPVNRIIFSKDRFGVRSEEVFVGLGGPACNREIQINHVGAII